MAKLTYETQACKLCGGSGKDAYTFRAACRVCNGGGKQRSAAANRAAKKLAAWLDEHASVRLDELQVGDVVLHNGQYVEVLELTVEHEDRPRFDDPSTTYRIDHYRMNLGGASRHEPYSRSMRMPLFRVPASDEVAAAYWQLARSLKGVTVTD
jgi:hypothetical protein